MADDWDDSSSDDAAPATKTTTAPTAVKPPAQDFDDSESEPEATDDAKNQTDDNNTNTNDNTANNDDTGTNDNTTQSNTNSSTNTNSQTNSASNTPNTNKNNNNNNKQNNNKKNNNNNNNRRNNKSKAKPKPIRQVSKPKVTQNNDDDSSTTSDSGDDDQNKANSKMQSYDDRYSEDNAILFGAKTKSGGRGGGNQRGSGGRGRGGNQRGRGRGRGGGGNNNNNQRPPPRQEQADDRIMLSGNVRLQSYPLGSRDDCIKLAKELTGLINGKRFDGDINTMDITKFVTYMIDGLIAKNANNMDIVDIDEIKTQVDKIYNKKQKDMRAHKKKKKPIHRFGKKYATAPTGPTSSNAPNQAGKHVDGQYNADDFDFLN